jgi:hypothetical protein
MSDEMGNGKDQALYELAQKLLRGEEDIPVLPPKVQNRLIAVMLVDMRRTQKAASVAAIERQKELEKKMEENPAVKAGAFVQDNPTVSKVLAVVGFITANLWFVAPFRKVMVVALGEWLKIPQPVIDFLGE